jgi:hypothetical protein
LSLGEEERGSVLTLHRPWASGRGGGLLAARAGRLCLDWRTVAALGMPFVLYLCTLAPTVYNLDSAELTTAAATGGIVRATGYPLYLLLGRVWALMPLGDVGYRMNLFSACNAALTLALAERILRRLKVGPWAAFGALGLLASAPFFWALSLIAEVYTLHTALMAGVILALLRWSEQPTTGRLWVVGFLLGASAGNHAATLLLVPGVVWYLLTAAPRRVLAPWALLCASGGLLVGLSVYLYLPLRYAAAPAFNNAGHYDATGAFVPANLQTLEGFWRVISGKAFWQQMFAYRPVEMGREVGRFGAQLWRAFFAIGIGPGLVGLVKSRDRSTRGMLLLMFVGNTLFYVSYRVADKETMFLPAYLGWALWAGLGYQALLDWMGRDRDERARRLGTGLLRAFMAGAVLLAVAWTWHAVDLSQDWSARTRAQGILDAAAPGALILGGWDTVPVVVYLQLVEDQRPDVQAINRLLISRGDMLALIEEQLPDRPVYIDATSDGLSRIASVESVGVLYRLQPRQ